MTDRPLKRLDIGRLKECRKRLDQPTTTGEVDEIAMEWLEDAAEVCSSYYYLSIHY